MEINLWVAFIAGLASFLSPCVLPLVPAYIGYMGGRATHTAAQYVAAQNSTRAISSRTLSQRISIFLHGIAFVAGFTFVFTVIGLLSTAFVRQIGGGNIALVRDILSRAGGVLMIFFGLHFTGLLNRLFSWLLAKPERTGILLTGTVLVIAVPLILWALVDPLFSLPIITVLTLWMFVSGAFSQPNTFWHSTLTRLQTALYSDTRRQMTNTNSQNYLSSAIMGVVFAAGWTPCIGPIYGTILTMAATGADVSGAGSLMIGYSLGLGIPFLLAALLLDSATLFMRKLNRHVHKIELASGAFLILIGLLVATGQMTTLSQSLNGQFADFSYRIEECAAELSTGEITLGEFFSCVNAQENEAIPSATSPDAPLSPDSANS